MAVTYGFYNSQNGDKTYDAEDFGKIFDGIILDGVFSNIGDCLRVTAGSGYSVVVGTGKAWFNHTWTINDAPKSLAYGVNPDSTRSRIDAVVLEVNRGTRVNSIKVISGVLATNPTKPTLSTSGTVYQYPLAYVKVKPNSIIEIEDTIGTIYCPFVSGAFDDATIAAFTARLNSEWTAWKNTTNADRDTFNSEWESWMANTDAEWDAIKAEWDAWMESVQNNSENLPAKVTTLETNVASIQNEIKTFITENSIMHRNTYRGKNLGSSVTAEQLASIRDGSFKDIYVGDYWDVWTSDFGTVRFRVVDIDYWLGTGNSNMSDGMCNKHHVVIMPDSFMGTSPMNSGSDDTSYGYGGSTLRDSLNAVTTSPHNSVQAISAHFSSDILEHYDYLSSETYYGAISKRNWVKSKYEVPSEIMIFGYRAFSKGSYGPLHYDYKDAAATVTGETDQMISSCHTLNRVQLALFRLAPQFIHCSDAYWLRDPVNAKAFAAVHENGNPTHANASTSRGVRPVFAIC